MAGFDFSRIEDVVSIPPTARKLLEKAEKEMTLCLNVRVDDQTTIMTDAYVVYYNTVRGPAKGGVRFAPNVTLAETRDLAERMVWKTALAGIPFGGGKSGVRIDARSLTPYAKREIIREFVHLIRNELTSGSYIPAPDMSTGPKEMAVIYGELHIPECVTGKPVAVGGLPGRTEATGRGVATSACYAATHILKKDISDCTVAVQGFGNVGSWTAVFLARANTKVVAVTNICGGVYNEKGLDIPKLVKYNSANDALSGFAPEAITNEELLALDVDILIPAAVENVFDERTALNVRARAIIEGANGPTTAEADNVLAEKNVLVIPDILANSGGVIASYVEWRSAKSGSITLAKEVYDTIDERIIVAFERMMHFAQQNSLTYRDAAMALAVEEVVEAMEQRGWV